MTRLRTIAPVEVGFNLTSGAAARDPEGFTALWGRVRDRLADSAPSTGAVLHFPNATAATAQRLYDDLSVDSLPRPLELVHGRVPSTELPVAADDATTRTLAEHTQAVTFILYDHAILLVELDADVSALLDVPDDEVPAALDAIHDAALELTEAAVRLIGDGPLRDVRAALDAEDPRHHHVEEAEPGKPLHPKWVSRALVADRAAPGAAAQLRHWLRDTTGDDSALAGLLDGDTDHLALWLSYAYLDTAPARLESLWRGMRYAQYFYAALDQIDQRLLTVLAQAVRDRKPWELDRLGTLLRSLSQRAELVIMDLQMVRKFVNRQVRAELDAILGGWDFEGLIAEPVRSKIASCDRRLDELAAGTRARANTVTDVILLGIAVTSVLATALSLTEFGRSVATDPQQAGFGVTRSAITEWFASQPADAILIGSVTVSLLLVVLFLALRRPAP